MAASESADLPLTMSVAEAAKALGVSRGVAYELVQRKDLRALRLGRRIVIPRPAIVDLLSRGPET